MMKMEHERVVNVKTYVNVWLITLFYGNLKNTTRFEARPNLSYFFFPPIFSTWNIEINFIIVVKLSQRVRKYRISKLYYCISQLY